MQASHWIWNVSKSLRAQVSIWANYCYCYFSLMIILFPWWRRHLVQLAHIRVGSNRHPIGWIESRFRDASHLDLCPWNVYYSQKETLLEAIDAWIWRRIARTHWRNLMRKMKIRYNWRGRKKGEAYRNHCKTENFQCKDICR